MAYDQALAASLAHLTGRRKGFEEKKMFGGVGFLLNGNMCVGVWKEFLIARLDPEDYPDALTEPDAKEFDITGRPMAGWVMVAPAGTQGPKLKAWVERAIGYVKELPAKTAKAKMRPSKK